MSNEETSVVVCKVCNETKTRIQDGMFDHKNKRWRSEDGLLWNGRKCGECVQKIQAEYKRIKKENKTTVQE